MSETPERPTISAGVLPWAGAIALWGAVFCVSCRLVTMPMDPAEVSQEPSVAQALLGESRLALSGHFYEIADRYLHKGVGHTKEESLERSPFRRLLDGISPEHHVHLAGTEIKELMPWLWLAIRLNPRNVETYLVASFWLGGDAGEPEMALEVLNEAQCNIPYSCEVQLQKGRILLKRGRIGEAVRAFDAGLAFWPGRNSPESEDARHARASLLLYRALLHEVQGEKQEAIAHLGEIIELYPERKHLQKRIASIEKGEPPTLLASQLWNATLLEDHRKQLAETCPHDEDEEPDRGEDDH